MLIVTVMLKSEDEEHNILDQTDKLLQHLWWSRKKDYYPNVQKVNPTAQEVKSSFLEIYGAMTKLYCTTALLVTASESHLPPTVNNTTG
jgi:hypothetical protein